VATNKVKRVRSFDAASFTETRVRVLIRNYFSTRLLWTAFEMTARAGDSEQRHTGDPHFDIEHQSHVVTAIISAAAFLEAAVNELFQDAYDKHGLRDEGYLPPLEEQTVEAMASVWRGTDEGSKLSAGEKWQLLLILAGRAPLDRGANPYQDAYEVTRLRNILLHFRPDMISREEEHEMEKRLKPKPFTENQLMAGSANAWWPDHCLGHGCPEWASRAVLALADEVCGQLGIKPNYRRNAEAGWFGKKPSSWPA
jgi:hypothetical protein